MTSPSKPPIKTSRRLFAALVACGLPAGLMVLSTTELDAPVLGKARVLRKPIGALIVRDSPRGISETLPWLALRARFGEIYREARTVTIGGWRTRRSTDVRRAVLENLHALVHRCEAVDVYLCNSSRRALIDDIERFPYREKAHHKLRFVYDSRRGSEEAAADWRELGAKLYVAHPYLASSAGGVDAYEFYLPFLRRWLAGRSLEDSVDVGNGAIYRHQPELVAQIWTGYEWGADYRLTRWRP